MFFFFFVSLWEAYRLIDVFIQHGPYAWFLYGPYTSLTQMRAQLGVPYSAVLDLRFLWTIRKVFKRLPGFCVSRTCLPKCGLEVMQGLKLEGFGDF